MLRVTEEPRGPVENHRNRNAPTIAMSKAMSLEIFNMYSAGLPRGVGGGWGMHVQVRGCANEITDDFLRLEILEPFSSLHVDWDFTFPADNLEELGQNVVKAPLPPCLGESQGQPDAHCPEQFCPL